MSKVKLSKQISYLVAPLALVFGLKQCLDVSRYSQSRLESLMAEQERKIKIKHLPLNIYKIAAFLIINAQIKATSGRFYCPRN